MKKIKLGKLVYVKWVDSSGSNGWQMADLVKDQKLELLNIHSVGWLLKEDNDAILIAPHISDGSEIHPQQLCGELAIPKLVITKMKEIKIF